MQADLITAYLVFAAVAAGTPGPANVLVMATAASVGAWRAIPCLLGVALGTAALLGTVALGLGTVLLDSPLLLTTMRGLGALLLMWLAWKIATADGAPAADGGKPVGFVAAAALQWVNPKSWLVAVSAAGTYLRSDTSAWQQALAFAALFALAALPAVGIWLVSGATLRHWLATARRRVVFNRCMGGLLAASVLLVVL